MNFKKILALSLSALAVLSLVSCGSRKCDYCKEKDATKDLILSNEYKLCDDCYRKLVIGESTASQSDVANTPFASLTDEHKRTVKVWIENEVSHYDAMLGVNVNDEQMSEIFENAAKTFNKTADEIKSIWEETKNA